jgi:hypothetical protein
MMSSTPHFLNICGKEGEIVVQLGEDLIKAMKL